MMYVTNLIACGFHFLYFYNVTFCFIETGTNFIKDGRTFQLPKKHLQSQMVFKSGTNYSGKPLNFKLTNNFGEPINSQQLYRPQYRSQCTTCSSKLICKTVPIVANASKNDAPMFISKHRGILHFSNNLINN